MTDTHSESIEDLIERSSLGTREGRARRMTVPASTGRAIARSAITGRYSSAATQISQTGRPARAGRCTGPANSEQPKG